MTNSNKSWITLICDRTGSMDVIRTDAEGAVNAFLTDQQREPLPCHLFFADFDDMEPFRIVHDGDLQAVKHYALNPRGSTPLHDAIGKGITFTGERLAAITEDERPGHVFFVVQTDGHENASREWTLEKVIEAVKRQEQDYAWTFIFLGAGKDAWDAGHQFAGTQLASNSVRYANTGAAAMASYGHASTAVRSARAGGQSVSYAATVDEEGTVTPEP